MNPEQVKTMITIDLIVWDELTLLMEKHPGENLHAAGTPWTSRDVYAHFARWFNHNNACIEAYSAGKEQPQLAAAPEEMNDIWQKEDCSMPLDEARIRAGVALASRLAAIEAVPPEKWNAELQRIAGMDGAAHFAMHINYISGGKS
jgi:hypothetical protein